MLRTVFAAACVALLLSSCDSALAPPEGDTPRGAFQETGVIRGSVTYVGDWPPEDSLRSLVFVALPFVPQNAQQIILSVTSGELAFDDDLEPFVREDSFFVDDVAPRAYVYNAVARQFGPILTEDWAPLGLYEEDGGTFVVEPGDTIDLSITVDFDNLPPFPPPGVN